MRRFQARVSRRRVFRSGIRRVPEALPREDPDFDLRLIEPASVSGRVVHGEAVPDFAADFGAETSVRDFRRWMLRLSMTRWIVLAAEYWMAKFEGT